MEKKKINLQDFVYNYPTKYDVGFTGEEIEEIKSKFPNINNDKFYNVLKGITCQMREGKLVIYHCDVLTALKCGIENRDMNFYEWD